MDAPTKNKNNYILESNSRLVPLWLFSILSLITILLTSTMVTATHSNQADNFDKMGPANEERVVEILEGKNIDRKKKIERMIREDQTSGFPIYGSDEEKIFKPWLKVFNVPR